MQNLPTAEIYEKEFRYFPWGILVKQIEDIVLTKAPSDGTVLDLMCGTGYSLAELHKKRIDLVLTGVDLEPEFIQYAKAHYRGIDFVVADAFEWQPPGKYNVVLCMAGVHHLQYEKQEPFIKKISKLITDDGLAIVADPYIDDYKDEGERKIASAKLGYEYLIATIQNDAPEEIVEAAIGISRNDVLGIEYKSSLKRMKLVFEKYFATADLHKTWPNHDSEYGDYYFVLRNPTIT
ncbi:MAG: class I SAM-dependent methyltransferase [Candidatus Andersenbacteria bacterium]|nr:class I SAM-dependent methyltransferase [Candidatus Andersenbacteria bacterium]MBI3250841.1 class I SAM-dependent methyltransferase [Candidatus Andersenbacteria bacterium]